MTRRVEEQVVVITGASSGIGRETALAFGERGASVVLAARNETALREVAKEIERRGGRSLVVVTDVADWEQVQRLAEAAVERFGRIDTWVNDAAVALYGAVDLIPMADIEQVVRVNLLGVIHGAKAAIPHLRQNGGGTIVNVGSVLSERAVPLQAAYAATKHGIKGFGDALRLELAHEQTGIAVTLVEPASINTPFFRHARSYMGVKPRPIPPAYDAKVVAEAIVFVAEHPRRTVVAGGAGALLAWSERLSPTFTDAFMRLFGLAFRAQQTGEPDDGRDNLFAPMAGSGASTGEFANITKPTSLYTGLFGLHPNRSRLLLAAFLAFLFARRKAAPPPRRSMLAALRR